MEILGSTFDDSVFEERRNKVSVALSNYSAKFCEPKWFCENATAEDELEEQKVFKFRADLAYSQNDYKKALADYSKCLLLIPKGNVAIRRDVLEGLARCHCHLGRREEALEIADMLRSEATNTSHLTCALNLQLSVHQCLGDVTEEISVLKQLISLHPYNPWYWRSLARCYWGLCPSASEADSQPNRPLEPGWRGADRTEGISKWGQLTGQGGDVRLKACMGFIRTRLLIHLLRVQQSSFVLQCNERALQEVEEALHSLGTEEETLRLISGVMAEDLVPEKMKEEHQDGESLAGLSGMDFDERWYDKLKSQLG